MEKDKIEKFIQQNSPDGGFLQSDMWKKFQESVDNETFNIKGGFFRASIIEHKLPLVGKYFYIPRGPIIVCDDEKKIKNKFEEILSLAKENNAGWVRIEPNDDNTLECIESIISLNVVKAPHNMQPSQIFIIDISKSETDLLTGMKPKTRYNIRLAERKGVKCESYKLSDDKFKENFNKFLELVGETASRKNIKFHQKKYYQKMVESIPEENIKLYVAKYDGKIIVANLVIFFGDTVTYLHGASANEHRNIMAPFLLQWQSILDAKNLGFKKYDFGGVQTESENGEIAILKTKQEGISKFKLGFSKITKPFEFLGTYDIILNKKKYFIYRILQKIKDKF